MPWNRSSLCFCLVAALTLAVSGTTVRAGEDGVGVNGDPIHLVVLAPPTGFKDTARLLGFRIVEQTSLGALGVSAVRLRAPRGESAESAVAVLREWFPDLVFAGDSFEQMDTSARPKPAI